MHIYSQISIRGSITIKFNFTFLFLSVLSQGQVSTCTIHVHDKCFWNFIVPF